ncbi:hypothetical protein [Prosthecobacter sp.]|uniref:hypothetical protein n=1 Tax=Prosthecobacter sp. TaxID=1965333 RepID=UPI00378442EB
MRIGKVLLHLEILACLAFAMPTMGGDLTDVQLRDGLTKLEALLGNVVPKNARWVQVESQGQRFGIFTREEDVFRTEGNAFLFDEKPGVEAQLVILHSGTLFTAKAETNDRRAGVRRGEYAATWKNADISKDVAAAIEWLTKESKKPGINQAVPQSVDPFSRGGRMNEEAAQLVQHRQTALYWSALLLRTGHEAESIALARAAFGNAEEKLRKQLLDGFFDRQAQSAYQDAMGAFAKHHDWAKLSAALTAVVNQFPLGWQQRDAARVFIHKVNERARLPAMPPIKASRPLSEKEQAVLTAWLQDLDAGKSTDHSRWTLPLPSGEAGAEDQEDKDSRASFPRNYGIAAVPLLAAILGDETLTLAGLNVRQSQSFGLGGHVNFGGHADAAELLRSAYGRLQTPSTRSQLAWSLLQQVLPQDLRSEGSQNVAEVAPDILAWYASLKDATPGEIALAYIEAGEEDEEILAQALTVTDPKKLARLENGMLESANVYDMSNLTPFVRKLGPEKAPAFIKKVRLKLEAEINGFRSTDQEKQRKQMESGLKRLAKAAQGEQKKPGLKEMLVMLAAYDMKAEDEDQQEARETFGSLPTLLNKLSVTERLDMLLPLLPDFKSPQVAEHLLGLALNGENGEGDKNLKPQERLALLERTRPHWQKLLNSKEIEDDSLRMLVQLVASLEKLVTGENVSPDLYEFPSLGDYGARLLKERASALLSGQKVEPLPSAAAISSDERKKLLEDLGRKTVAEIGKELETISVDKLLALNQALMRGAEVSENLKTYIATINEVKVKDLADATPWQAFRGKGFSKDTMLEMARQISAQTGGPVTVELRRNVPILGLKLQVRESKKSAKNWELQNLEGIASGFGDKLPKLGKRLSMAYFQQQRTNAHWHWLDAPMADPSKETPKATGDDDDAAEEIRMLRGTEKDAWGTLANAAAETRALPLSLVIISAATADLVKKED